MNEVKNLDEIEAFIKNQMFCEAATPCTAFMSESYKKFRIAFFRVLEYGRTNTACGQDSKICSQNALSDKCEVYLDHHWKLELVGDVVYLLRLEPSVMASMCETGIRKRAELEFETGDDFI